MRPPKTDCRFGVYIVVTSKNMSIKRIKYINKKMHVITETLPRFLPELVFWTKLSRLNSVAQ